VQAARLRTETWRVRPERLSHPSRAAQRDFFPSFLPSPPLSACATCSWWPCAEPPISLRSAGTTPLPVRLPIQDRSAREPTPGNWCRGCFWGSPWVGLPPCACLRSPPLSVVAALLRRSRRRFLGSFRGPVVVLLRPRSCAGSRGGGRPCCCAGPQGQDEGREQLPLVLVGVYWKRNERKSGRGKAVLLQENHPTTLFPWKRVVGCIGIWDAKGPRHSIPHLPYSSTNTLSISLRGSSRALSAAREALLDDPKGRDAV